MVSFFCMVTTVPWCMLLLYLTLVVNAQVQIFPTPVQGCGCPKGYFPNGIICDWVKAGCFQPNDCYSSNNNCPQRCPLGSYSLTGSRSCQSCNERDFSSFGVRCASSNSRYAPVQQAIGSSDIGKVCPCAEGYTGACCSIPECPSALPRLTLMTYVFNGDVKFAEFLDARTDSAGDDWIDLQLSARLYMNELFRSTIDTNGDEKLTSFELQNYLVTRSFSRADLIGAKFIWCSKFGNCVPNTGSVAISTLIDESLKYFADRSNWSFDNTAVATAFSPISGTFPKPSMDDSSCKAGRSTSLVTFNWSPPRNSTSRSRFCGYTSGSLAGNFNTDSDWRTDILVRGLSGPQGMRASQVSVDRRSAASNRVLFCMAHLPSEASNAIDSFQCTSGLNYDGSPLDLTARLTNRGVVFSFLDTATTESQFSIFKDNGDTLVAAVNYPSQGCGRLVNPIAFTDQLSMMSVGVLQNYSVNALLDESGTGLKSTSNRTSRVSYRIPFLATLTGEVTTEEGAAVAGVTVTYCRINPVTELVSTNPAECPLKVFVTDSFGSYEGELRVSSIDWTRTEERFEVTASFNDTLVDGSTVVHKFSPARRVVKVRHVQSSIVQFIDKTTITVSGQVQYKPSAALGNAVCSFAKWPVTLIDKLGNNKHAESGSDDGRFSFSVTQRDSFQLMIPAYEGRVFSVAVVSNGKPLSKIFDYTSISHVNGSMFLSFINTTVTSRDIEVIITDETVKQLDVNLLTPRTIMGDSFYNTATSQISISSTSCSAAKGTFLLAYSGSLPAMEYEVKVINTPAAPVLSFSSDWYCGEALSPLDYLQRTQQDKVVVSLNASASAPTKVVSFVYRSALCMQIIPEQQLARKPISSKTQPFEEACFANRVRIVEEGVSFPVTIRVFELYPSSSNDNVRFDGIDSTSVNILDLASGVSETASFPYNGTELQATGFVYNITALNPRPSLPFTFPFMIAAERTINEYVTSVSQQYAIPVVGKIAKEVPNVIPVAGDPNLIFHVLRDPPGSNSRAILSTGTAITFDMSMTNAQTFDGTWTSDVTVGGGIDAEYSSSAGIGIEVEQKTLAFHVLAGATFNKEAKVSAHRASNSHYQMSMTFNYDISTSNEPFVAGAASDVIVGGGVDIIAVEALEVFQNASSDRVTGNKCLRFRNTYQWKPGKMTTFVFAVFEIENIITKLLGVASDITSDISLRTSDNDIQALQKDLDRINKQVSNWKKVLLNYRAHNNGTASLIDRDNQFMSNIVKKFDHWYDHRRWSAVRDFVFKVLDGENPEVKDKTVSRARAAEYMSYQYGASFEKLFIDSYKSISDMCDGTVAMFRNEDTKAVCNDFKPNKWSNLYQFLQQVCSMPTGVDDPTKMADSSVTPWVKKICATEDGSKFQDLPGGKPAFSDDFHMSLLGFVTDPTNQYLTFSSNSMMTISWESTVSDSVEYEYTVDMAKTSESSGGMGDNSVTFPFGLTAFLQFSITDQRVPTISIGKHSSSSHTHQRKVTVELLDYDAGDYFVVRMTSDKVYGTPIFKTIGGQSKCPGESLTTRRESGVTIKQIKHRCGQDRASICSKETLQPGEPAVFSVVIENLSPTKETVDYNLLLTEAYDTYVDEGFTCGRPGQYTGLDISFSKTSLLDIPYRRWIEVPFTVTPSINFCYEFVDIGVKIEAACEAASPLYSVTPAPFQYDVKQNPNSAFPDLDFTSHHGILTSTAKFSVSWPSPPTFVPTQRPTPDPTVRPTAVPTANPTRIPTANPTMRPTARPTVVPTYIPSATPTVQPSQRPTAPTAAPTAVPTRVPTNPPTAVPTRPPVLAPTRTPTRTPTRPPTQLPTRVPSRAPLSLNIPPPTTTACVPGRDPGCLRKLSSSDNDNHPAEGGSPVDSEKTTTEEEVVVENAVIEENEHDQNMANVVPVETTNKKSLRSG